MRAFLFIPTLFLSIPVSILEGFVLHKLWGWFVIGYFSDFQLGIVHAIGISLLVAVMTHQTPPNDGKGELSADEMRANISHYVSHGVGRAVAALCFGKFFHLFM